MVLLTFKSWLNLFLYCFVGDAAVFNSWLHQLVSNYSLKQAWSYQVTSTVHVEFTLSMFASCGQVPALAFNNYLLVIVFFYYHYLLFVDHQLFYSCVIIHFSVHRECFFLPFCRFLKFDDLNSHVYVPSNSWNRFESL